MLSNRLIKCSVLCWYVKNCVAFLEKSFHFDRQLLKSFDYANMFLHLEENKVVLIILTTLTCPTAYPSTMVNVVIAFLRAKGLETSQGISCSRAANVNARTAADHAKAVTNSNNRIVVLGNIAAWSAPAAVKAQRAALSDPAQPPSTDARYWNIYQIIRL